jgi:hypothetical protein
LGQVEAKISCPNLTPTNTITYIKGRRETFHPSIPSSIHPSSSSWKKKMEEEEDEWQQQQQ